MILKKIVVGPLEVNCYILGQENTGEAIVIDPGADPERIKNRLKELTLKPKFILNTHGHADHIGANGAFACPVYIHRLDAEFLNNPSLNLSGMLGISFTVPGQIVFLEDKQKLKLGKISLEVIHTPGHTPGSICLSADQFCFTGDTLFAQGIGRTDIPKACEKDLFNSIREKLFNLQNEVVIYPGHGPSSTIGEERMMFSDEKIS